MNTIDRIQFVRHKVAPHRRHYVDEDDVKVVLSRLPEELWSRLRKVHFKDDAKGNRRSGYTTIRGRREITLCALPPQVTISLRTMGGEEFGAVRASQWPVVAVRRFMLYDTFLHELGHLQMVLPKSVNPDRKFASETLAQEFADAWRRKLWSEHFDHPDPAHSSPTQEELQALKAGWIEANLAYKKAQVLFKAKKYNDALPHLQRAVELYPDHAMALQHLGDIAYFDRGNPERHRPFSETRVREAVRLLRGAVAVDPTLPQANLILAMALGKLGEQTDSRQFFARAIKLDPYDGLAKAVFADALSRWGCAEEAEALFKTSLRANPDSGMLLADYAEHLLFRAKGDSRQNQRKAVELLKRAIKTDPRYAWRHYQLALAYSELGGHVEQALEHVREALRLDPEHKKAAELLEELTGIAG